MTPPSDEDLRLLVAQGNPIERVLAAELLERRDASAQPQRIWHERALAAETRQRAAELESRSLLTAAGKLLTRSRRAMHWLETGQKTVSALDKDVALFMARGFLLTPDEPPALWQDTTEIADVGAEIFVTLQGWHRQCCEVGDVTVRLDRPTVEVLMRSVYQVAAQAAAFKSLETGTDT